MAVEQVEDAGGNPGRRSCVNALRPGPKVLALPYLAGEQVEDAGVHCAGGGVQVGVHVAGHLEEARMVRHHVRQQPQPHLRTCRGGRGVES